MFSSNLSIPTNCFEQNGKDSQWTELINRNKLSGKSKHCGLKNVLNILLCNFPVQNCSSNNQRKQKKKENFKLDSFSKRSVYGRHNMIIKGNVSPYHANKDENDSIWCFEEEETWNPASTYDSCKVTTVHCKPIYTWHSKKRPSLSYSILKPGDLDSGCEFNTLNELSHDLIKKIGSKTINLLQEEFIMDWNRICRRIETQLGKDDFVTRIEFD